MQDESILRQWERWYSEPPEDRPVFECDECGQDICEGYDYYLINGKRYCPECVNSSLRIAEEE